MRQLKLFLIMFLFATPCFAQTANVCKLLENHADWHDSLVQSSQKWGVDEGAIMAFLDQESRFRANAQNGVFYGYSQASPQTWNWFLKDAKMGDAKRDNFDASVNFVGWHIKTMSRKLGIELNNTYSQYLAYKLGEGGYKRGASETAKKIANSVAARGELFSEQLKSCK